MDKEKEVAHAFRANYSPTANDKIMERGEQMNLDNIKPGMRIKNYKELCRLLEIEPKTSDSKKKQLKEIDEVIKYEKSGHAFIIKEIYDKRTIDLMQLKYRERSHKNQRNIYIRHINPILLQILNNSPGKKLNSIAFKDICILLNLSEVTENEKYIFKNIDGTELEMTQVQRTFAIQKMASILKSAINSLVNKRYITCQYSERKYTISLSSSVNVINLQEEEFQKEQKMLHKEFIEFIKSNYL